VAEDVAAVNPDLVVRDKEGKPYSVRYEQVNAMLLNEFLKAHRKIQEQEATITQLRKEMETVVAHAKEQDSRIQKVSDQIETNKATPGVVRNNLRRPESNSGPQ
jgi:predicted RNA methylase